MLCLMPTFPTDASTDLAMILYVVDSFTLFTHLLPHMPVLRERLPRVTGVPLRSLLPLPHFDLGEGYSLRLTLPLFIPGWC